MTAEFQNVLWGYALDIPDGWTHQALQGADAFAALPEALDASYQGPQAGHLLVRGEWNCARQPIEPFWTRHIGMLASMMGAREVGSAPWQMGGAAGFEAEIVLPKRENKRLWTGILSHGFLVLKFMVLHPKEARHFFEPHATRIISSLRFPDAIPGLPTTADGLPIPPEYSPAAPSQIVADIQDPEHWQAYEGQAETGALQAFYLREAPNYSWKIEEFVPFPSENNPGFARFLLSKGGRSLVLGIMPSGEAQVSASSPGNLVIKRV